MSAELKPELRLEIAHLLLIDVVGYSQLLVNEQVELLHELNRVVRNTPCFRAAEQDEKLIRLPTGDGMALLFYRSPEQPVQCALEIAEALKKLPQIRVRMGVHSGPVNQVTDVNDRSNVAGSGINIAQRVLDCGDAGHILLSKHLADDLGQYGHWRPYLQDLGECEVKHGLRLHVVNLHKDDLGNAAMPQKLRGRKRWRGDNTTIRPVKQAHWPKWALAGAVALSGGALVLSFVLLLWRASPSRVASEPLATTSIEAAPEKSIAVLPFENLSNDPQNAFFADGVQDEILTDLAKVADVKVISRTSVMQYRGGTQRNLREIAKALGVSHVLEGTVQRMGDHVRVNAQLIDARTDTHIWSEGYNRAISDLFALENELSEQIVSQLKLHLSAKEKAAIELKPTSDLAAYDLYIRSKILIDRAVFNEPKRASLMEAVDLLNQALARDGSFALAYYQLAHAHDQIYWNYFDRTPQRQALAQAAIDQLRRLRPDAGETHLAIAKHRYWAFFDFEQARTELAVARRMLPNDPGPYLFLSYIDRRQGHWDESLRNMKRALELDPRNALFLQQISLTYICLRDYANAATALDRALELTPHDVKIRIQRAMVDFDIRADLKSWRATLESLAPEDRRNFADPDEWLLTLYERNADAAAGVIASLSPDGLYGTETVSFPRSWLEGMVAHLRGDEAAARSAFTAARATIEKFSAQQPDNAPFLCALGVLDAALGRKKDAVHEARRAVELVPPTRDAIDGTMMMQYLAIVYAWTGKKDAALDELAATLKLPGYLSYGQLKLDPLWDPLRNDPRFEKIVAGLAPK